MSERVRTVLVVDPDPATAQAARGVLPPGRFQVLSAALSAQATEALAGERVDVVLSELALGDASGLRLLVEIRRLHPTVPRLVVTAVADFDAAVAAINEAEVFRFLRKPVPPLALREAIEEALGAGEAAHEMRRARETAERRRSALVDLEAGHPGIAVVSLGPDGYLIPADRVRGLADSLGRTPLGRLVADALASSRDTLPS
jgi:DNA-binding NtrC family response regulator